MVDEGRSGETFGGTRPWENQGSRAAGTILATALAAGVIAFLLRRSREEEQEPTTRVSKVARGFAESDAAEAGRDFFMDRILPELKPALLSILEEVEDAVDRGFRQVEKSIKKL